MCIDSKKFSEILSELDMITIEYKNLNIFGFVISFEKLEVNLKVSYYYHIIYFPAVANR